MPDQGSEGLLSPFLRNKRISAARPYIFGRVLDIGCGTGKLASLIPSNRYLGVDIDVESIDIAKRKYPNHKFQVIYPSEQEKFDTVIALAVIEHVSDGKEFLSQLFTYLEDDQNGRIVLTSPHPFTDSIHYFGSRLGLFSRAGNEEHEKLYIKKDFEQLATQCGLQVVLYKRFLLGLNQLVIYQITNRWQLLVIIAGGIVEDGIVVGNLYDKYSSNNIIVTYIMQGFEKSLTELADQVNPGLIHEVGCGDGYWVINWHQQGIKVRGSDVLDKVIEIARSNASQTGITESLFHCKNFYDITQSIDEAELIVCCEVLE